MKKVVLVTICLNPTYWPYLVQMVESARKFFLQGHQVDFICWSDIPLEKSGDEIAAQIAQAWQQRVLNFAQKTHLHDFIRQNTPTKERLEKLGIKIISTQPFDWPLPTLYRYHLFLKEEELLNEYDCAYYCDADMEFVSRVGDEVLPVKGLVGAQHPMYAIKRGLIPPYEPNIESAAYIERPGRVVEEGGKKKFEPLYFAGGFQGGNTQEFIKAMKVMKERIDSDFSKNYIAIWNDETHWNKYLHEVSPEVVLNPSYVYPDSLNRAYYIPLWGKNYTPKIITITKPFSLSIEGGLAIQTTT